MIAINGRFLTRPGTGVDRVAAELAHAFDRMIAAADPLVAGLSFEILAPAGARELALGHVTQRRVGRRGGHMWEQVDLARETRGRLLLNFCNTGPALKRESLTILHDAQIYQQPGSYSRAFRTAYRVLLPLLGRRSRHIFTVSDFSRRELERFGVVAPGRLRVSHNGCDHMDAIEPDTAVLHRLGIAGEPFVLALGSPSPHKNLAVLLRAAAAGGAHFPRLLVAGALDGKVFAASAMQGQAERVDFIGRIDDRALKALLQSATALLFPSITEGFGLPPLEAMRVGCPVIASRAEAVMEVCGEAALYADAGNEAEWREAVERLATDATLRAHYVRLGRSQASGFTWQHAAERILRAIRET